MITFNLVNFILDQVDPMSLNSPDPLEYGWEASNIVEEVNSGNMPLEEAIITTLSTSFGIEPGLLEEETRRIADGIRSAS